MCLWFCRLVLAEPTVPFCPVGGGPKPHQQPEDLLLRSGPDAEVPEAQRDPPQRRPARLPGTDRTGP